MDEKYLKDKKKAIKDIIPVDILKAISELEVILDEESSTYDSLLVIKGHFIAFNRQNLVGTIADKERRTEFAKILLSLIELTNGITESDLKTDLKLGAETSEKPVTDNEDEGSNHQSNSDDILRRKPTVFFYEKFTDGFPGVRGLQYFEDSKELLHRLSHVLSPPMTFDGKTEGSGVYSRPIWWCTGMGDLHIESFQVLSHELGLLDGIEIYRPKGYAYSSVFYYKSFIYLQISAQSGSGVYSDYGNPQDLAVKYNRPISEEYAKFDDYLLTREEYDDGAFYRDGKIINPTGPLELRTRYLTPSHMIICAITNPMLEEKNRIELKQIMQRLLLGEIEISTLVDFVEGMPRSVKDY